MGGTRGHSDDKFTLAYLATRARASIPLAPRGEPRMRARNRARPERVRSRAAAFMIDQRFAIDDSVDATARPSADNDNDVR